MCFFAGADACATLLVARAPAPRFINRPGELMDVVRATRRVHFSAAHRLHRSDWSDERNREVFGDCANPNWHGHNYEIDVTVEGPVDPETGFLMDLKDLKELLERRVLVDVDHKNLNTEVPWLEGI